MTSWHISPRWSFSKASVNTCSEQILKEAAKDAAAVVAWGSCASNGCIQHAKPNPTNATPIHQVVNRPVINVPGCPPIGDVMMAVVTHILVMGHPPELDSQGRPREFYGRRVHDTCYRRPYYDAGLFVEAWDDEGARAGYCLYKMGCRGPVTYNACSVTRWNEGTSCPIQSGHGCIGCSENNFWDNGPFYRHLASFPGFGIESTADTIGTVVGIGTLGLVLDLPPDQRLEATLATTALGVAGGADIVRVHDVRANVRAARMADAIVRALPEHLRS